MKKKSTKGKVTVIVKIIKNIPNITNKNYKKKGKE